MTDKRDSLPLCPLYRGQGSRSALVSMQQAEHGDTVGRAHDHLAVGNGRRDEFIAAPELIPISGGLIAVVDLVLEIGGVKGVQHRRAGVLVRPDDGGGGPVCRYRRSGARKTEQRRGLGLSSRREFGARYRERLQGV